MNLVKTLLATTLVLSAATTFAAPNDQVVLVEEQAVEATPATDQAAPATEEAAASVVAEEVEVDAVPQ